MSDGGRVTSFGGDLGNFPGSTGAATISGPGSKWTISRYLYVGHEGTGTLTVADGGLVTVKALSISGADSFINIATGGMLALRGNVDDSLAQFFGLVSGTDAIRYWDASLSDLGPAHLGHLRHRLHSAVSHRGRSCGLHGVDGRYGCPGTNCAGTRVSLRASAGERASSMAPWAVSSCVTSSLVPPRLCEKYQPYWPKSFLVDLATRFC